MVPGIIFGILIYLKTKTSEPPDWLLTFYAMIAFLQSIAWINFASNSIVDLLKLFGFILSLPQALLSLTVLAWGNCLGDMTADVAMTKKGFGEMAMTATVAGPIFNILIGQGISMVLQILTYNRNPNAPPALERKVEFSLYFLIKEDGPVG